MLRSSRYRSTNEPQPSELNPSTTVQSKRPPSLDIPQNRSDSRPSDMVQSKRPPPLPSAATLPRNAMASLMSEVRASGGRVSGEKPAVRKSVPPPLPVSALPGTINQQEKKKEEVEREEREEGRKRQEEEERKHREEERRQCEEEERRQREEAERIQQRLPIES